MSIAFFGDLSTRLVDKMDKVDKNCPLVDKTVDKMDKTFGKKNALVSVDLSRGKMDRNGI